MSPEGTLAAPQIAALALGEGLQHAAAAIATAVALAESRGDPTAYSGANYDGSHDQGLWQVNNKTWNNVLFNPSSPSYIGCTDPFAPSCNAKAMAVISRGGSSWTDWTTFTSGAYRAFLPQATAAVNSVVGTGPAGAAGAGPVSELQLAAATASPPDSGGLQWKISGPLGTQIDLSPILWYGAIVIGGALMLAGIGMLGLAVLRAPAAAAARTAAGPLGGLVVPRRSGRRTAGQAQQRGGGRNTDEPPAAPPAAEKPAPSPVSPSRFPAPRGLERVGGRYYRAGSPAAATARLERRRRLQGRRRRRQQTEAFFRRIRSSERDYGEPPF